MLHYMQMRNWFIVFMALTLTYMIHQRMNQNRSSASTLRAQAIVTSIFR
ncbi:MAG: hypothetical protein NDI63_01785 [Pseudobdellovibrio sp.]|nr:hypothetical protein [Pseudobdellovibrio sp.]